MHLTLRFTGSISIGCQPKRTPSILFYPSLLFVCHRLRDLYLRLVYQQMCINQHWNTCLCSIYIFPTLLQFLEVLQSYLILISIYTPINSKKSFQDILISRIYGRILSHFVGVSAFLLDLILLPDILKRSDEKNKFRFISAIYLQ